MFCHKCGAKVKDGARFCQNCGAKLILEEEPIKVEKPVTIEEPIIVEAPTGTYEPVSEEKSENTEEAAPADPENSTPEPYAMSDRTIGLLGLVCGALGIIAIIGSFILINPIEYTQDRVNGQHLADSLALEFQKPFFKGGFALLIVCAVVMILDVKLWAAKNVKKSKKATKLICVLLGISFAVVAGAVLVMVNGVNSYNSYNDTVYINAAKSAKPFDTTENRRHWGSISYANSFSTPSYEDVFSYYLDSLSWTDVAGQEGCVNVSGQFKGGNERVSFRINLSRSTLATVMVVHGKTTTDSSEIEDFLYEMFDSYVKKEEFTIPSE